jgi:hypothetical protein
MIRTLALLLALSGCATLGQDVTLIQIDGWHLGVYERDGFTIVGPAEGGWDSEWIGYRNAALKGAEQIAGCKVAGYVTSGYRIQATMDC